MQFSPSQPGIPISKVDHGGVIRSLRTEWKYVAQETSQHVPRQQVTNHLGICHRRLCCTRLKKCGLAFLPRTRRYNSPILRVCFPGTGPGRTATAVFRRRPISPKASFQRPLAAPGPRDQTRRPPAWKHRIGQAQGRRDPFDRGQAGLHQRIAVAEEMVMRRSTIRNKRFCRRSARWRWSVLRFYGSGQRAPGRRDRGRRA